MTEGAIGLFDSGVGGLSVLLEVGRQLPDEEVVYFADTRHMPYGSRSREELQQLVFAILDWLVQKQVKLIIMACNTSSALVLERARQHFPVPILGMIEPTAAAVANWPDSLPMGVIATEATIRSNRYEQELLQAGFSGEIYSQPCPELASLIESGASADEIERVLAAYLLPLRSKRVRRLVMACTHYPFVAEQIAAQVGPDVELIDPAVFVVREAKRLLNDRGMLRTATDAARHRFFTSGNVEQFENRAGGLLGRSVHAQAVRFEHGEGRLIVVG